MNSDHVINDEDIMDSQKFVTMKQDSIVKLLLGITTVEEVFRVLYD